MSDSTVNIKLVGLVLYYRGGLRGEMFILGLFEEVSYLSYSILL